KICRPAASMVFFAPAFNPPSSAVIFPLDMPTSEIRVSVAVITVPPRIISSKTLTFCSLPGQLAQEIIHNGYGNAHILDRDRLVRMVTYPPFASDEQHC